MRTEFFRHMFGDVSPALYLAAFIFAFLGFLLSLFMQVLRRDRWSYRTPVRFSWRFLLSDNARRIAISTMVNVIAIYLAIRFSNELLGVIMSPWLAFLTGFTLDKLIEHFYTLKKEKP